MSRSWNSSALLAACLLAAPAVAGDEAAAPDAAAAETPTAAELASMPDTKMVKTQFKAMRFQEDWRALKEPGAETDHWFPAIKQIELAKDWDLSVGGQVRYQNKTEENRNLLGTFPGKNEFSLLRLRLHGDLRIQDDARIFVELLDAGIHGNAAGDPPPGAGDRNNADLLNAFIELIGGPEFRIKFGRTQMQYGVSRVIDYSEWPNVSRTFEGGVATLKNGNNSTDVFVVHPVVVNPRGKDHPDLSRYLSGAYSSWKLDETHTADAYLIHFHEADPTVLNGAGNLGTFNYLTMGGRYAGKEDAFDWDGELALQRGFFSGDNLRTWMASIFTGYTLASAPGSPRLGLDVEGASGDDNSTDGQKQTYQQLFPSGHMYFGYIDLVGRQNIIDVSPNARWKLGDTAWFRAAWHDFNLNNDSDSLYNASGAATFTDPNGGSGNHVGQEVDLTLGWNPPWLAPHGAFQFGYCYFSPGNFVSHLGDGNRAKLLFAQFSFTF